MTLAEKIQNLRKEHQLSQDQLAAELGVSRQSVSKWELGDSKPDVDRILQLSRYFQVSTDYLLKDDWGEDRQNLQQQNTASETDFSQTSPDNDTPKKKYPLFLLLISAVMLIAVCSGKFTTIFIALTTAIVAAGHILIPLLLILALLTFLRERYKKKT